MKAGLSEMRPSGLGVIALAMAISCRSPDLVPLDAQAPGPGSGSTVSVTASAPTVPVAGSQGNVPQWEARFDFDGDAVPDRVELGFTEGAHCCYHVAIALSSGRRVALPFEVEGGYVGGLNLSRPDRFNIVTLAGGRAELRLEVATYNGFPEVIPPEWVRRFGVRSHRIGVSINAIGFHVANLGWRCDAALKTVQRGAWAAWEGLPDDCSLEEITREISAARVGETVTHLGTARSSALLVKLGSADAARSGVEVVLLGDRIVQIIPALDTAVDAKVLEREIGTPAVRLDGAIPGADHVEIWAERGIAIRINRAGRVVGLQLFASMDLDTFRRDLAL